MDKDKAKDRVQINIDVSDNPWLRKAFRVTAAELDVSHSVLGKFFVSLGVWVASKHSLVEAFSKVFNESPRKEDYLLIGLQASAIELREMGFPKIGELERLAEEVRVFLEKKRSECINENGSDA